MGSTYVPTTFTPCGIVQATSVVAAINSLNLYHVPHFLLESVHIKKIAATIQPDCPHGDGHLELLILS
jgi:hypothetical protein